LNFRTSSPVSFQLQLIGFSENDKLTFESILSLAGSRLDSSWQITLIKDEADFFVLSSRLREVFEQDKLLQTLPRERCIFCVLEQTGAVAHELLVDKNNIPFLRPLTQLLNSLEVDSAIVADFSPQENHERMQKIKPPALGFFEKNKPDVANLSTVNDKGQVSAPKARSLGFFEKFKQSKKTASEPARQDMPSAEHNSPDFLSKPSSQPVVAKAVTPRENEQATKPAGQESSLFTSVSFAPSEHPFIRLLLEKNTDKKLAFSLDNVADLYIDLQNQCYYGTQKLEALQGYFNCQGGFVLKEIGEPQLQMLVAQQAFKPQPLNNLLWYSVLCSSQGKFIIGHQSSDIVRLKRWPDINLPGCRELIQLAAYMHSNSADLQTIHVNTGFPIAKVIDFYNACKVIDLIELCQESDIHEKTISTDKRKLYAKIGKRIKSLS